MDWTLSAEAYKIEPQGAQPESWSGGRLALFSGYFEPYVNLVWDKYTTTSLSVDTKASFGTVQGKVSAGTFSFSNVGNFSKPSTRDIFSCSTGPFLTNSAGMSTLTPRLSAALNRSTLLSSSSEPANAADYYKEKITNHYSRIVHETNIDGKGYALPYDGVSLTGGTDQSGSAFDQNPSLLRITVGGASGFDSASRIRASNFDSKSQNGVLTQGTSDVGGEDNIGWIANGDWAGFDNVDFHSDGMEVFIARISSGAQAGISGLVQLAIDSPTATPVASFSIQNTGGWQNWTTVTANMRTKVTDTHPMYLTFASGQSQDFVNVNWFTFEKAIGQSGGKLDL